MAHGARRDPPSGTTLGLADAALRDVALRRGLVTMAMARGPPLHRRPRGAGAAETTSWAVGGAPHMSPTPIWLVGHRGQAAIAATGVSGAALNSLFYRSNCLTGSAGRSHCRRVLAASSTLCLPLDHFRRFYWMYKFFIMGTSNFNTTDLLQLYNYYI